MYLKFAAITLLLLINCLPVACAQHAHPQEKAPWSFGMNGYYGALFRYKSGLPTLSFTNPVGVEAYANRHTLGNRPWEVKYRYPLLGFGFSYYNYGVPDELGEAFSLTTYLDNALVQGRKNSLRFNLGAGLVYSTRYYKPETNEGNKAIGNPLAFVLRGTLRYEFPLSRNTYMNVNFAFRHFSNGGWDKPNNGMNFPLLGLGLRYQKRAAVRRMPAEGLPPETDRSTHLNLRFGAGVKEVLLIDTKHPVYNLSVYGSRKLTRTNTLLLGADGFYDTALREEFINVGRPVPDGELDARMAGVTVGHQLHLGRLSLVVQLGRYLYQPLKLFPDYYQRYGLQYDVTQHVSASVMLLAHTRTANVVEWGLGLQL
ncbi:acyloxyacyl hydrolase [Pontibacter russatus]|uniref:acyloxyacyl hydrolase n=1 Tax=Pontibacter russatus TaxID=2694929 RepID=UPI001379B428|nr:acyloxyacyl hydrolase [Pontibacter russatus]